MEKQMRLFEFSEKSIDDKSTPAKGLKRKIKIPQRNQVEFKVETLDESIPADHQARTVWNFIKLLDFSEVYERYSSLEDDVGRPIADPKVLVALWIYAICDGIISARKIAQYCLENKAYAWLCGGISVGHHLLSGFRSKFSDVFEGFVIQSIAILLKKDLITLKRVSQDGKKLRASASLSMHRKSTIISKAMDVRKHIKDLEEELQRGNFEKEQKKTKHRELLETQKKKERLIQAAKELQKHKENLNKNRAKNRNSRLAKKDVSNLRISTTDPECRKMKMADSSYKPAYNVQIATDVDTELVLKTGISQNSDDGGELLPMYSAIRNIYGVKINSYLADSAFRNKEDFQKMFNSGCFIYLPTKKKKTLSLRKRVLSGNCDQDTEADKEWIRRMEKKESNELYNRRIRVSETMNAFLVNHGMQRLLVRGVKKVKGFIDLACLAYNMITINRLYEII